MFNVVGGEIFMDKFDISVILIVIVILVVLYKYVPSNPVSQMIRYIKLKLDKE